MYLGAGIAKVETIDSKRCWTMSSEKYVKEAVRNVKEKLSLSGLSLPTKCSTPFLYGYHPSDDVSAELDADSVKYYQELIGALQWAVELGRVDILLEVALLSTHLCLPRTGHLQQVYHIFGYLDQSPRKRLFFNPTILKISAD